jgi:molybdopterin-guanine dinucleotide biosynthesis protein A
MPPHTHRAAIVLCGGASRRMGSPKALLKLGKLTFLEVLIEMFSEICETVVVVAAPDQTLPIEPGRVQIVHDEQAYQGPLTAIEQGLSGLPDHISYTFVSGTDTPLLKRDVVRSLFDLANGRDGAIPIEDSQIQPLAAVYRVEFAKSSCRKLLGENRHRAVDLASSGNFARIPVESFRKIDPHLDSFRNINTPEEYSELIAEIESDNSRRFEPG